MNKFIATFLVMQVVLVGSVYGATTNKVTGKVGSIKARTDLHANTSVRGFVSFQVEGELVAPCTWIYFPEAKINGVRDTFS